MLAETRLSTSDLIYPIFVIGGANVRNPVVSMPDIYQLSIDNVLRECEDLQALDLNAVLLFGIPDQKDERGTGGYAEHGIVQNAVAEIKKNFPGMLVITDVCLCEYTSHGHCGVVENGDVVNDESCALLAEQALSHARAGADIV